MLTGLFEQPKRLAPFLLVSLAMILLDLRSVSECLWQLRLLDGVLLAEARDALPHGLGASFVVGFLVREGVIRLVVYVLIIDAVELTHDLRFLVRLAVQLIVVP